MIKKKISGDKSSSLLLPKEDGEKFVRKFLLDNSDFFKKNEALLSKLNFPHSDIGESKSLIERQNAKLKKNLKDYEGKLSLIVDAAEFNEMIFTNLINWFVVLLKSKKININLKQFIELLADNFDLKSVGILLFSKGYYFKKELSKYELKTSHSLYSHVKRLSGVTFKQIPSKESDVLLDYFQTEGVILRLRNSEIKSSKVLGSKIQSGSMVLIPLKNPEVANDIFGNLIMVSDDKEKFDNGKGVVFLSSIAKILSSIIYLKFEKG